MATDTGLLPTRSRPEHEPGSLVVPVREAEPVVEALSSRTARRILTVLAEDPMPVSGVADRVDTSLQNATYHVEKLHDAGLIESVDTWYSKKGLHMDVYASSCDLLVLTAGESAK